MMPCISPAALEIAKNAKILVAYHRADMDGKLGGAIAYSIFEERAFYLGMNYEEVVSSDVIDMCPSVKKIFLIDYCFPPDCIKELCEHGIRVVVLDHHHSALKTLAISSVHWDSKIKENLLQLYTDDPCIAGCEVAWTYFYPEKDMPRVVELVGIYDTWKLNHPSWSSALNFNAALYLQENTFPDSPLWTTLLFGEDNNKQITELCKIGATAELTRSRMFSADSKSWGGKLKWEGFTFFALNTSGNSKCAEPSFDPEQHEAILLYRWSPRFKQWKVSMYHCPTSKVLPDLSEIAIKYGGGGHKGACGFSCKELPFKLTDIE